jgi:hypothetical protein
MDRRYLRGTAVLLVCCVGGWFALQPDVKTVDAPFTVAPTTAAYDAHSVVESGDMTIAVQRSLDAEGVAYERRTGGDGDWEWVTVDNQTYTRVSNLSAERFAELNQTLDGTRLQTDATNRTLVVVEEELSEESVEPIGEVAQSAVTRLAYERVGERTVDGRAVVVYEPVGGWYDSAGSDRQYHVASATGTIHVGVEDNRLYFANVSYRSTGEATVWEDPLTRATEDIEPVTIEYDFTAVTESVQPEWVGSVSEA